MFVFYLTWWNWCQPKWAIAQIQNISCILTLDLVKVFQDQFRLRIFHTTSLAAEAFMHLVLIGVFHIELLEYDKVHELYVQERNYLNLICFEC